MIARTSINKVKNTKNHDHVFSILIPSWNNLPYLRLCVESIRKNSTYAHQIIVHINEGNDGSLAWVQQQPDIDYVHSSENIGVCYALNGCRSLISTSYVLFINDDMYVCPGWDEHLKADIDQLNHPYFYFSSTAIEPVFSSNCAIQKDYGSTIETFQEKKLLSEFSTLPMNDWQGSTWPPSIVHIDVWDLIGGYSAEFSPGMYSDPDFSMKLWNLGIRLFKGISKSRVYHFGSKSVKRVKRNRGYYKFVSKWGVTSSTLSLYLQRGEPFTGTLKEPTKGLILKYKNFFRRIAALFI